MAPRTWPGAVGAAVLWSVLGPQPAYAHRLDEYLQATTLAVGRDRIAAQLRLTPGVLAVPAVFALIDTDGDGLVSPAEQRAYAGRVLRDLQLTVDGTPLSLRLVGVAFPDLAALRDGMGEIVVEVDARVAPGGPDRRLTFENRHQPRIGVYLVNVLVPRDPDVHITAQHRDPLQTRYQLDYAQTGAGVLAAGPLSLVWWAGARGWLGAAGLLPLAWIAAGRSRRDRADAEA